jgi:hypothetical protein
VFSFRTGSAEPETAYKDVPAMRMGCHQGLSKPSYGRKV